MGTNGLDPALLNTVHCMDCLEFMKTLPSNSIDSIVTDPPYGLSFMGKKWDHDVPSQEIREECLRILKPGGYLLAFAGTRTQHRMAVRIEDAGFEIRDMIAWVYGSGFPKSLNIGKAVDKLQGNEREALPPKTFPDGSKDRKTANHKFYADEEEQQNTYTNTKGTSEWEGYGTALKPALEPITVARKPLSEKTVAENCLKWGTGGINIDGCRVGYGDEKIDFTKVQDGNIYGGNGIYNKAEQKEVTQLLKENGRFPANLIHDGSDEVVGLFPETKTGSIKPHQQNSEQESFGMKGKFITGSHTGDSGSASRFFYVAKASKSERNKGLEGGCTHKTVKPVKLMQYLVRLVTAKGGVCLDPFTGSGTTGIACKLEGVNFIGVDREQEYVDIANARIDAREIEKEEVNLQPSLFG